MKDPGLLLCFYGDDFTGSSATMEVMAAAGLRTALFLEPPTREALARFPGLRAVGVAGMSRTFSPAEIDGTLPAAFERLAALRPALFHYKICSTFDSSPEVGSIGRAIDVGQRVFGSPFVPLVVGAPAIGRYCLFGNLFARAGSEVVRLDRHPTMRAHPVTPMEEGDLRVHLARQTDKRTGLMDLLQLAGTPAEVDARFRALLADRPEIVLFDVLDDPRLAEVGRLIWENRGDAPLFTVGSQGLEYALVAHFRAAGRLVAEGSWAPAKAVEQLLVVSGSCSPDTERQISHALENGFAGVDLGADSVDRAVALLRAGKSVLVHSARGPKDARIARGRGAAVGEALGRVLHDTLARHPLPRVVLSGGDTSGHGTRALGIQALELLRPAAPGAPICRAHAPGSPLDGLELVLKGGQMGRDDLFTRIKTGEV